MSAFSRAQKIAALVSISVVVVATLIVVGLTRTGDGSADQPAIVLNPDATPTPVPALDRPRGSWDALRDEVAGAAGTAAPVPCPFVDERQRDENSFLSLTPGLTFICDVRGLQVSPIAPGRVVMAVGQPPLNSQKATLLANGKDGPWIRAAAYGSFVVIDHGPLNQMGNVTTVYAGLDAIDPDIAVGRAVDTETSLGTIGARSVNGTVLEGVLTFEFLRDDTRFGADPLRASPPPASESPVFADVLEPWFTLPVTTCSLPFGNPDLLVGAPRTYRSGTHNGLDFNCGTSDHVVRAAADGEVLFVVDGDVDANVEDRNAVLANAAEAVDTPFWSLAMLYGRFVVVAHHLDDVPGRVVSIYAHLSDIDDDIVIGRRVTQGTPIGLVGNSGTSAAAAGIDDNHTSVHLHWELHVDDRAVGYLQAPERTEALYLEMLCSPEGSGPLPCQAP